MKKTITSALLTLALVGFANAAPPAAETVDSLKAKVEALLANNQILKDKIKELTPSKAKAKAKDVVKRRNTVVTRKQLQEAYVKAFDLNKDGKVSIKETPNRKQRNEFLHNFQNDNYRQDEIPVAQRRNSKPPKARLNPPANLKSPAAPDGVEHKPLVSPTLTRSSVPINPSTGLPVGVLIINGQTYVREKVAHDISKYAIPIPVPPRK